MNILRRIYNLLLDEERKKLLKMAVTVLFSALLDFAGLAVLLPVLYSILDDGESRGIAVFFCMLAVGVVLVKSVLATLFARYQNKCLLSFYRRLSFSLFASYYSRGLLFIREHGSNKLGHEINAMCYSFSHSLLAPICRMAGDLLLILLVTAALLIWNGTTVLILFASFIPFMCFYIFGVRKRVRKIGDEDMNAKRGQARVVSDAFRGFVELEVSGAFPTLQRLFLQGMDTISHNRMKLDILMRLPLFLSELSVIVGFTMLLLFAQGDVKMVLGVFAVTSFRLLPALRTVLTGWTQIQNSLCTLDVIEEGLKGYEDEEKVEKRDISFESEICMDGISYAYPGGETIFDGFTCRIAKGEYVGFCGSSGAGKSTLFNMIIGLIEPDCGEVRIDGVALTRATREAWMKKIGYVPQEVFIFNGTLAENIALGCEEIDYDRIEDILKKVRLEKWAKALDRKSVV